MKTSWLKALSLISFCLLLSACGSASRIGNVLVDLTAWKPTASEDQINVTLRYTNENVFAIALSGTEGKLYLNNEYVGAISNPTPVGLPQLTSLERPGLLKVEKPEVLQRLRSSSAASVAYRLDGVLRMEVSEDKSRIKSTTNGQLDLNGLRAPAK